MLEGHKKWFEVIKEDYPTDSVIGIDPRLLTADAGLLRVSFLEKAGFKVDLSIDNIVDHVWVNRPANAKPPIFIHEEWAGKSITEKVGWVREKIQSKKGNAAIFNGLSEIGWILNLRSSEIPHNPFFKGVLIIRKEGGSLYLPKSHPSLNS